jgi:hypothetical protein
MCADVEALARAIAGQGADSFQLSQARIIAAAQLDLLRVHSTKVALMNSKIGGAILSKDGTDDTMQNSQSDDAGLETSSDDPACETKVTEEFAMVPTLEALQELARLRRRTAMRAFLTYQRS